MIKPSNGDEIETESHDNARPRLARSAIWALVDRWTQHLTQMFTFVVLARILGPETYGIISIAIIYMVFVNAFLVNGFSEALIQRKKISREHLSAAFWCLAVGGSIAAFFTVLLSDLLAVFFSHSVLGDVLKILSLGFVITGCSSALECKIVRDLNFRLLAVRSLIAYMLSSLVAITLALNQYGIWSIVVYQLCLRALELIVLLFASEWLPSWRFGKQHLRHLWHFGVNSAGMRVIGLVADRMDRLLVGYFIGAVALGHFAMAGRLIETAAYGVVGVLNTVALPLFSRLQDHPERLSRALYLSCQISTTIAFPVFVGLALVAPFLIESILTKAWGPMIVPLQILCLQGIAYSVSFFLVSSIRSIGRSDIVLWVTLVGALLRVIGCLAVINWGIEAVSGIVVAVSYVILLIYVKISRDLIGLKLSDLIRPLTYPLLSTMAMAVVVSGLAIPLAMWTSELVCLLLLILIGIASYGLCVFILDRRLLALILGQIHARR